MAAKNFIQKAIKHPGALHQMLDVPMGQNIPMDKMHKAAHSNNDLMAQRARLALTLRKMHKK